MGTILNSCIDYTSNKVRIRFMHNNSTFPSSAPKELHEMY